MRRLPTIIGAGLVAAATASAIAVTSGTAQAPGERTLTFVERSSDTTRTLADVPPLTGKFGLVTSGDTLLFRNALLDAPGGTRLGRFEARCGFLHATSTFTGSRAICDGIYTLGGGTITASAAVTFNDKPITFAVTGGTGAYEGARGSGTTTARSARSPLSDTTIHLLP